MGIKRRLFVYNTISVLVALVAMLAVNSIATHFITANYQHQFFSPVSEEASQAQQLLQGESMSRHDWPQLDRQLQEIGFSLHVSNGGQAHLLPPWTPPSPAVPRCQAPHPVGRLHPPHRPESRRHHGGGGAGRIHGGLHVPAPHLPLSRLPQAGPERSPCCP